MNAEQNSGMTTDQALSAAKDGSTGAQVISFLRRHPKATAATGALLLDAFLVGCSAVTLGGPPPTPGIVLGGDQGGDATPQPTDAATATVTATPVETDQQFVARLLAEAGNGKYPPQRYTFDDGGRETKLDLGFMAVGGPSSGNTESTKNISRANLLYGIEHTYQFGYVSGKILGARDIKASDGTNHNYLYLQLPDGRIVKTDIGKASGAVGFYNATGDFNKAGFPIYTADGTNIVSYLNKAQGREVAIQLALNIPGGPVTQNIDLLRAILRDGTQSPSLITANQLAASLNITDASQIAGYMEKTPFDKANSIHYSMLVIRPDFATDNASLPEGSSH